MHLWHCLLFIAVITLMFTWHQELHMVPAKTLLLPLCMNNVGWALSVRFSSIFVFITWLLLSPTAILLHHLAQWS